MFSLDSYRSIIRAALDSGALFRSFSAGPSVGHRAIFLRHDVDYSLEMAVRLAEVNADLGVRATFFVLLRSQIYNLMSDVSLRLAERLGSLGQDVGLHSPLSAPLPDPATVDRRLCSDFAFVKADLPVLEAVASWHNPTTEGIERYVSVPRVGGLVNVYSAEFCRKIPYYSDSNMRHSVEDLIRLVRRDGPPVMQLVLHPLYWVAGGTTMNDVFAQAWPYIIREREYEFRTNRSYAAALPDGMPTTVLEAFSAGWRRAVEGPKA